MIERKIKNSSIPAFSFLILNDMSTIYTEIEINASKQRVWQALYQKEDWVEWNSFLSDRDSSLPFEVNQILRLSVWRSPADEDTEFQAIVKVVQPAVCLSWVCEIPGFRGEYWFELQEIGEGRTKYIHREEFSGWISRVFLPFIREDEKRGMDRMARELKGYVEKLKVL
ncbi:SRPBCC domain-containing protein [Limnoraphis robusta Tam1]|uniref:SRPBCC domain-containing protein n=1 Tax=Limnoraphis robusta TaxID=1118279 RepID=UPI002B2031D6|nr:SRPBCC domain-containing protein [Limnoraphis robusta]MEA5500482.1 SRPBCC domain-containing protein [Limnoraphis robusta BA-68 BA1]MEA5543187.1 SRPBCC domain-containing protein [Limnoraphis robusta Tam1]